MNLSLRFTAVSWESCLPGRNKNDPSAFIFSLVNAENRPLLANCSDEAAAIYCNLYYGPTFGGEIGFRDLILYCGSDNDRIEIMLTIQLAIKKLDP